MYNIILILLMTVACFGEAKQGYATVKSNTLFLHGFFKTKPAEPLVKCKGVRRNLTPASWGGVFLNGKEFICNPGDTLILKSTYNWGGLDIENFHGTTSCPIVIINEGDVKMGAGFKLNHCTYIKVTGSGTSSKYGFNVSAPDGTGVAIEITGRSSNIEVERINVHKKTYGAWVKQEANCADSLQYPNWWIDNISLHDCKFLNIGQDGLYFGSTSPTGQRDVFCNGRHIRPVPLRLSNIKIYNNIIDSCNRTGIQLSGADKGNNEIYNNKVLRCGYELNQTQGSGIILGGMTRANVYSNYVRQTFQHGIFCIGSGYSRIENNNIDSSGLLGKIVNKFLQPTCIFADSHLTLPANDRVQLVIRNNKLGRNAVVKGEHIILFNSNKLFAPDNVISGNTIQDGGAAKISVASDIKWKTR